MKTFILAGLLAVTAVSGTVIHSDTAAAAIALCSRPGVGIICGSGLPRSFTPPPPPGQPTSSPLPPSVAPAQPPPRSFTPPPAPGQPFRPQPGV